MEVDKSSRHQKIIGMFGENLICNLLSRSGFEVAIVDHTGLDIIAYNRSLKRRFGISVKSRTRNIGKENTSVNIFRDDDKNGDRKKLTLACSAFGCEPWIGICVETQKSIDVFLTSLDNYDAKYRSVAVKVDTWKMGKRSLKEYINDPNVYYARFELTSEHWNW